MRVQLFAIPWTIAYQAPLSMEFSRQEYWSGLPCHPPGDLPNSGIKPPSLTSPALAACSLPLTPSGKYNKVQFVAFFFSLLSLRLKVKTQRESFYKLQRR